MQTNVPEEVQGKSGRPKSEIERDRGKSRDMIARAKEAVPFREAGCRFSSVIMISR